MAERKKHNITPEEFVEIWQKAESIQEVIERTGIAYGVVVARVAAYRTKGVHLKKIGKPGRAKLDVDGLNALIDRIELEKKTATRTEEEDRTNARPKKKA